MTTTLDMDALGLLSEDWQLEPSLGLTLFDDPWKAVDFESTGFMKSESQSSSDDLEKLLGEHTNDIADPFCESWMESAGIAEMLESLVQDSAESMTEACEDTLQGIPTSEELSFKGSEPTEIKGHEILRSLIEQGSDKPVQSPPSPDAQVAPTIDLVPVSFDITNDEPVSTMDLTDMDGIIRSPLSVEDVESFLSGSEPSSPGSSCGTTDTSACSELEAMLLDKSPKLKSRTRSTPYSKAGGRKNRAKDSIDSDSLQVEFLSKKDKKKLQNKNAAIRYRMKKKAEAECAKTEEDTLESKNKELNEKVEQLTREIQYMKDLMAEVYKAKGILKT